jgi:cell wall-associated NlpC family hydrolase
MSGDYTRKPAGFRKRKATGEHVKRLVRPLQTRSFRLNFGPMRKFISLLTLFGTFCLAPVSGAQAVELGKPTFGAGDQQGFFERYSNTTQDVILKGLELVGIHYRFGGNTADSGLDCSGFVRLVFKDATGLVLPRSAREMSEVGEVIEDRGSLKPGDLVFFNTMRRTFSHVGIYLGDNYFLHAPKPGAEVRVESMENSYWVQRYNGARRLIDQ